MKTAIAICALMLLSACATTEPVIVTKEVKVPVPVPCKVEEPAAPDYRFSPPYENVFEAVRDLLGDREQSLAHEAELRAALRACK